MAYHISHQGQTSGPFPAEEIRKMLQEGRILPDDLCWTEGMAGWKPLGEVFGTSASTSFIPQPVPAGGPSTFPAPGPPTASQWPAPPEMHWIFLLLLSYATCGIFVLIWLFFQTGFVKQLHPGSPARAFFAASSAVLFLGFVAVSYGIRVSKGIGIVELALLLSLFISMVLIYMGVFSMRRSLLYHYNTAENIALNLDPILTFFFHVIYFQYHFSRIARWKRTGVLA